MIATGEMDLDDEGRAIRCPLCGAGSQRSRQPFNGYEMAECSDCSFVYTRLRIIPASQYEEVYSHEPDYLKMVAIAERTAAGMQGFRDLRWFKRKALRWIENERPGGRLQEVGSGPGTFLLVAQRRGWDVTGVEPTKLAADRAQSLGVKSYNGTIASHPYRCGAPRGTGARKTPENRRVCRQPRIHREPPTRATRKTRARRDQDGGLGRSTRPPALLVGSASGTRTVVAVAHLSRKPGYWKDRLTKLH